VTYVQSLERRVELAEESLQRCHASEKELNGIVAALERRNQQLMEMLFDKVKDD